jgi:hypothetical protein
MLHQSHSLFCSALGTAKMHFDAPRPSAFLCHGSRGTIDSQFPYAKKLVFGEARGRRRAQGLRTCAPENLSETGQVPAGNRGWQMSVYGFVFGIDLSPYEGWTP